jgi:hypothetical protein
MGLGKSGTRVEIPARLAPAVATSVATLEAATSGGPDQRLEHSGSEKGPGGFEPPTKEL